MSQQPSGWYGDPTKRHRYRYWDGSRWANQVSDGGTAGVDPVELDEATVATPPAPGTQAPGMEPATTADSQSGGVEVPQRSSGAGPAAIIGVLVGALIVILVVVALLNNAEESTTTTVAPGATVTTLAPEPTEAP